MPYAPSTQPESIGAILKRSFSLYRYAFVRVIPLALLIAVIAFIPRLYTLLSGKDILLGSHVLIAERLWLLIIELINLVLFTFLLWRTRCVMYNMHESAIDDVRATFKKLPRIFGAVIIENIIVISLFLMIMGMVFVLRDQTLFSSNKNLPLFLIIIPIYLEIFINLFILILLMFYLPLILNENKHIFEALAKSAVLVWGNWWRTFITQLTPWFIYLLALLFIRNILGLNIRIYFLPLEHFTLAATCVHIIIFALFLPWIAATMLVQLQDLEIRKSLRAH